jgi:pyruvate dehydrogenase E2 component (dihydrolipoyllysine-residue acetyltransferase)
MGWSGGSPMADVVMPRLSDSMEEGTILQWLKSVGDEVAVGDELVEIETDKANMAYESDLAGTLSEILVQEGETVAIGTPIARVGAGDGRDEAETRHSAASPGVSEGGTRPTPAGPVGAGDPPPPAVAKASSGAVPSTAPPADEESEPATPTAPEAAPTDGDGHRPKASPLARRIAKERQLDLSQLQGSGPGGRIVKADVERAAGPAAEPSRAAGVSPETAKGEVSYEDLSKLQATIARRMAESKATAPHFYLRVSVDMSEAVQGRSKLKEMAGEGSVVPSFNDMVVKACALALREHPRANGAYRDGRFELYSRVNVGIAVATEDGLVVPTVFDADRKGLRQIASESRTLAQRVRDGQITPPELSGATFTVSNLGMYGIEGFSAVINPPQAAILAVGAIEERPVARNGEIATAHLMSLDLACDHRILYGAPAAEFLARIRALLEEPLSLAL